MGEIRVLCGGYGYSAYNWIGVLRNDLDVFQTAEGDATVLHQQHAKYLLKNYKKSVADFGGLMNHLSRQAMTTIFELNPVTYRSTSRHHLCDANFQIQAFSYRLASWLSVTASKVQNFKKRGTSSFDSWNKSLDEVIKLSKANVQLFVLNQFQDAISQCHDADIKYVLSLARNVYALSNIEQDMGFFRTYEYISSAKSVAISELLGELCNELRHFALDLVNCAPFLHDKMFPCPIAYEDGKYMEHMMEAVKRGTPFAKY